MKKKHRVFSIKDFVVLSIYTVIITVCITVLIIK